MAQLASANWTAVCTNAWKVSFGVLRPSVFKLSQTTPAVLHFSAGEPHLYLAKQTIFCVKN